MSRLKIITGHYGSGKTEFVLNYAYKLRNEGKKVYIIDVDVINVYFRSREKLEELKKDGIEVIGSNMIEALGSDLPAVSFSFMSLYKKETDAYFVMDLAGSKNGLNICKTVRDKIDEYEMIMVVNVHRSETATKEDIINQVNVFEGFSTLDVSSFVNNTNMLHDTTFSDLVKGHKILKEVSEVTGKPILCTLARRSVIENEDISVLGDEVIVFDELKIRKNWL